MNIITSQYLRENPNHVFVFGDNLLRKGLGGAAKLRNEPNTYGFITKKYPNNKNMSFYKPEEYRPIFQSELIKFVDHITFNYDKLFLVSKLGSGLANKYGIYEFIIHPTFINLDKLHSNIQLINNWT